MPMRPGFSKRARESAAIAREIRFLLGEQAYDQYKRTHVIPTGLNRQILQAHSEKRRNETKTTAGKGKRPKTKYNSANPPAPKVRGLEIGVKAIMNSFLSQAYNVAANPKAYDDLTDIRKVDDLSNRLLAIVKTTNSPDERDLVLAALGRVRAEKVGLNVFPSPRDKTIDDELRELSTDAT